MFVKEIKNRSNTVSTVFILILTEEALYIFSNLLWLFEKMTAAGSGGWHCSLQLLFLRASGAPQKKSRKMILKVQHYFNITLFLIR